MKLNRQRALPRALFVCCWLCAIQTFAATPSLRYELVARYPHLNTPFTEGLELDNGVVYESSGRYWHSYVQTWQLTTQKQIEKQRLPYTVFGEGLTVWANRLYVLTWREHTGFIFDKNTLQKIGEFSYRGEGWGLTHNDRELIMSDGTAALRFIDPQSLRREKTVHVSENGVPLTNLNELEWIPPHAAQSARLLANIWLSDSIAVIDAGNGRVTARIDLSRLYPADQRSPDADVLNGIARDERDQTLLVTGKFWPYIYRIRLLDPLP